MRVECEEDLKVVPGLRWEVDEDGTVIARPQGQNKAQAKDHLFFWGPGRLGIYVERRTKKSFAHAIAGYLKGKTCFEPGEPRIGDQDGILVCKPGAIGDIPKIFMKSQARADVGMTNLQKIKRRSPCE